MGGRARAAADAVKPRDTEATGEDGLPPDISPYVRDSIVGRNPTRGGGGISGGSERITGGPQDDVQALREAGWVAKRLGISRWAVYELAKRHVLPCVRLGKLVRFDEIAIEGFIASGGASNDDRSQIAPILRRTK